MIRQVDKSRFNIPMSGHPKLHRELMWYATDDDAVLGVVILDLVDKNYSWVMLTENDKDRAIRRSISEPRSCRRMTRQQRCTTP